jgi:site-specific recombinase XerD
MNTNIVLSLDTRKPKKDSTCPVLLRIVHLGQTAGIRTGIYVQEKDWDFEERKIKSSYRGTESVSRLNNRLQKLRNEAMDYVIKLDEQKRLNALTVTELKDILEKKPQKHSFYSYTKELIKTMKEAHHIGNSKVYEGTLTAIKKFMEQKELAFISITPHWLKKFENHFLKKPGNTVNGLAVYMRTIRAIFNQAIKARLVDKDLYPFTEYTIQKERTKKRAIPVEYLRRIQMIAIPEGHRLFNARTYFLASYMLRGMNFTDLALLKVGDIQDGRIIYDRAKTGATFNVKVPEDLRPILEYYIKGKTADQYIFPVVIHNEPEKIHNGISWARKRFNKRLKELAKECSIQTNLTSYVARHSFATRAKNLGIPIANIAEMLGHSETRTTEIYLDSLPSDMLDEMHERIIK